MRRLEVLASATALAVFGLVASPVLGDNLDTNVPFESDLNPTGLGTAPALFGVAAGSFEWRIHAGKAEINEAGDLEVAWTGLLIAFTDGLCPTCEGTTTDPDGPLSFYVSLFCGGVEAGNTAGNLVTPVTTEGNATVESTSFLADNGITDCPGAVILVRADTPPAGVGGADPWVAASGFPGGIGD